MFELEGSNLQFKFLDESALKEDIMFFDAIYTDVFC